VGWPCASLVGNNGVFKGDSIKEWGKIARRGVEIQPMSQERIPCGGKQGRAAVNGSPDRGRMQSLIGVIDIALPLRYFSV